MYILLLLWVLWFSIACMYSCCYQATSVLCVQSPGAMIAAANPSMYANQAASAVSTCRSLQHASQIITSWFMTTRIWKTEFWYDILGITVRCGAAAANWLRRKCMCELTYVLQLHWTNMLFQSDKHMIGLYLWACSAAPLIGHSSACVFSYPWLCIPRHQFVLYPTSNV